MRQPVVAGFVLAAAILFLPALHGCGSALEPDSVQIRVLNADTVDFESVVVVFPEEREEYGAVPAGQASQYRAVRKAYRIAYVEVEVAGRTLVLQPIDYVGERLLEPGEYTYELTADLENGSLALRLVVN